MNEKEVDLIVKLINLAYYTLIYTKWVPKWIYRLFLRQYADPFFKQRQEFLQKYGSSECTNAIIHLRGLLPTLIQLVKDHGGVL